MTFSFQTNGRDRRVAVRAKAPTSAPLAATLLICLPLLASMPGCSKPAVEIYRVTGTVTRGGQPLPNLMIHFMPIQGRPSWGSTDSAGHYELHYAQQRLGAVPGAHRVFVKLRDTAGSSGLLPGQSAPLSADQQAIVARYGKLETSPLKAQVERDGQVIDFALDDPSG